MMDLSAAIEGIGISDFQTTSALDFP